ncbi:LysM peptidoglycan-binding domain-containing protein [Neobacillus sedimentimangrovi]|uniref:LysM peptidoglycan-binding domain-containing protein n=1 Tax=Neobacillus sedimentimangrovi TaxID=2699460 RepID=A0ABS8QDT4_9BACI|nr:LysM peptidoglycan-binding domain-containing protein [Neobacillus sedimentimangrovi]MCD4837429.1 LysM peptidoglycan-binding domain-containing protein [Neobacillus sedimentimangrovi]
MNNLWSKYSYAIILFLLSGTFAFILSFKQNPVPQDQYITVTVSEGDSLLKIAGQYSEQHTLSNEEFIDWVKKYNKMVGDQIFPGDEIMIPVSKEAPAPRQLASALEE